MVQEGLVQDLGAEVLQAAKEVVLIDMECLGDRIQVKRGKVKSGYIGLADLYGIEGKQVDMPIKAFTLQNVKYIRIEMAQMDLQGLILLLCYRGEIL